MMARKFSREFRIIAQPPQEDMGIDQILHARSLRKAAAIDSVSGASKSGGMEIFPLRRPGMRGVWDSGTHLATGRPSRTIKITSPVVTRSRR